MSILKECKNKTNILEILPLKNINNLNLLVMDYCDKGVWNYICIIVIIIFYRHLKN